MLTEICQKSGPTWRPEHLQWSETAPHLTATSSLKGTERNHKGLSLGNMGLDDQLNAIFVQVVQNGSGGGVDISMSWWSSRPQVQVFGQHALQSLKTLGRQVLCPSPEFQMGSHLGKARLKTGVLFPGHTVYESLVTCDDVPELLWPASNKISKHVKVLLYPTCPPLLVGHPIGTMFSYTKFIMEDPIQAPWWMTETLF